MQNSRVGAAQKSRFSSLVPGGLGFGRKDDATVDIPLDTVNVRV